MVRLLPMKEVVNMIGLSRAKIYELIKVGEFIPPTRLTECRVAFRSDLLEQWINERPFVVSPKGGLNGKPH